MAEDSGRDRTLHQRILGDIESRIVSGAWPPGHRLPFEVDLATQYGCSRMTVNKVMTQLAKSGLIERRRKSGSFVTQPQAQSAVLEINDIEAEVRSLNLAYGFRLTERVLRKAGEEDLRLIDVPPGAPLLVLSCVHMGGPRPFCREERLISLATVPEADRADFSATPPGQWLIGQVPWSAAEHRIRAVNASADMAATLAIAKGTACLVVERRTWSGQGAVTHVCLTYPGDSHTLMARFTPASQ
ncbi:histidine utilization repressor [Aureimonas endophytica]|uniref:Histidine utilization repressor n=1 Tax=Aureimonas endophytica TaxID=2027858 RepID=A0A916ZM12_9HYPH|nr:histidine utilization repressor [Aureimonas endophytica]